METTIGIPGTERSEFRLFGLSKTDVYRILSILGLFALWEIGGLVPISVAFPTFSATMVAMFEMILDGRMFVAYADTIKPLLIGVAISAGFGVAVGVTMGLSRRFQWFWEPIFVVLQAAPVAALIPLITYIYGIGLAAKVVAVIILALPIIVLNAYKAVRNASASLVQMCHSFQGTRLQQISKVIIPNASPVIFTGLRLGVAGGFIGVILAELLITPTGIGDLITYHRSVADYAEMYATVVSIILFSAFILNLLQRMETRLFRPETRR